MKIQAQCITQVEEGDSNWILHFEDGTVTGIDRNTFVKPTLGEAELFTLDGEDSLVVAMNIDGEPIFDRVAELEAGIKSWRERGTAAEAELKRLIDSYGPMMSVADHAASAVRNVRRGAAGIRSTLRAIIGGNNEQRPRQ